MMKPLQQAFRNTNVYTKLSKSENYLKCDGIREGLTLVATDRFDAVIGVIDNETYTDKNEDEDIPYHLQDNRMFCQINNILNTVQSKISLYTKQYDYKEMEIKVITVHKDWRMKGVGKALLDKAIELARQKNFTSIRVTCTSEYSRRLVCSRGFDCICSIEYREFMKQDKLDVLPLLHKTHYEVLGLPKDCTTKEVKHAYISLSKRFHPDNNKDEQSHANFVRISEAYKVLSKPELRRTYDWELTRPLPERSSHQVRYSNRTGLLLHKTHYEVLGLPKDCTTKEVKHAYISLSKRFHPDNNKDEQSHANFVRISEAYKVLSKPELRRTYDWELTRPLPERSSHQVRYSNRTGFDPYSDPSFWRNRSRRYNNDQEDYYGVPGIKKLSNGFIASMCLFFTLICSAIQFYVIRNSYDLRQEIMKKKSKENEEILQQIRTKVESIDNDEQFAVMERRLLGGKYR
ncbi:hypothetical protein FQR65_LT10735 [Abscondita terminalis]|nr:hypothetical protein FQR65_LT10735 [Abscondita terminalis]